MRDGLKDKSNDRKPFSATFKRFGSKKGYQGRQLTTVLFVSIFCDGKEVCDHVWFTLGKQMDELKLTEGDRISFNARVKLYQKGYRGRREGHDLPPPSVDYKLSHPSNIKKELDMSKTQLNLFQ